MVVESEKYSSLSPELEINPLSRTATFDLPNLRGKWLTGISVVRNPRSATGQLLLVLGRNDEELKAAAKTLSVAVETMGQIQLGKTFSEQENAQIVAFLKTLTGEQPAFLMPILPPSTDATPKPKPFD